MTVRSKAVPPVENPPEPELDAPVYRTEGQRLLCALTTSPSMIAREIGVVKGAVSNWRAGSFIPNDKQRRRLEELFGVPFASWERLPQGALPPVAEDEPEPRAPTPPAALEPLDTEPLGPEPTVLEDCFRQLRWLRKQMERPDILQRERLALNDAFRKALKDKSRYELDAEMSENRMVRNHPAWQRFKPRLLAVLKRHPAAAREVADLLTELLGEEDEA